MNTPDATAGSPGAAGSALYLWRQQSRPLWRKHKRAARHMMRWMYLPGARARRRLKKWVREYERTLNRIPMPPEDDQHRSDDYAIDPDDILCDRCGGDGSVEYDDAPDAWGEDCPSDVNHLIPCPDCRGSGERPNTPAQPRREEGQQ